MLTFSRRSGSDYHIQTPQIWVASIARRIFVEEQSRTNNNQTKNEEETPQKKKHPNVNPILLI